MDGTTNWVVDCLSRYYETDGLEDKHPGHEFMSTDAWLDLDGELLPVRRYIEVHAAAARRSHHLAEKLEQCMLESDQMNEWPRELTTQPVAGEDTPSDQPPLAIESGVDGESLCARIERTFNLVDTIHKYYCKDPTFAKVLAHPEVHPHFRIKDGLIWTKNQMKKDVVCLPRKAFLRGRRLVEVIIDHAHTTIGHFGQLGTSCYIGHYYW